MNVLFQVGIGSFQPMLDLVRKRHENLSDKHDGVYLQYIEAVNPSGSPFWEKWHQIKGLMEIRAVKKIVAADADVIWQHDKNIFDALPDYENIGVTEIKSGTTSTRCAGVVWIRNTPTMHVFVDHVLSLENEFCRFPAEDQSAMIRTEAVLGLRIATLLDEWHTEDERGVLRGFHRQPDRLVKMESVYSKLIPIRYGVHSHA